MTGYGSARCSSDKQPPEFSKSDFVPGEPASDSNLRPDVCLVWAQLNADLLQE